MNKPGRFEYFIGSIPAFLALAGGTWAITMFCLAPEHPTPMLAWAMAVAGFVLTGKSARARRRVVAYKAWARRWNAMAAPPGPGGEKGATPRKRGRIRWGRDSLLLWCGLVLWLIVHDKDQGTPFYGMAAFGFMGLSVVGAGAGVVRLGRRMLRGKAPVSRERGGQGHIVSICPSVPLRSPNARGLGDALPEYCRAIMAAPPG